MSRRNGRMQGDRPVTVSGTFLLAATTIVSGTQQSVWKPSDVTGGSFGTRLQDLCTIFDRIRWKSLKLKFGISTAALGGCLVGFDAAGENAAAPPAVLLAATVAQMSRVGYAPPGYLPASIFHLTEQDLNPTPGYQDIDTGSYWNLYVTTVSATTALAIAGFHAILCEYTVQLSGAVDPSVFLARTRRLSAAIDDDVPDDVVVVVEAPPKKVVAARR